RGEEELGPVEFMDALEEKLKAIGWDSSYLTRPVNDGFSGGEKKRNEILQLAVLDPRLAILDETDSGLDIDALKTVAHTVDKLRRPDNATVLVTHYYRILTHIRPDFVHVLADGRIVKSGGKELALELEEKGYDWLREAAPDVRPRGSKRSARARSRASRSWASPPRSRRSGASPASHPSRRCGSRIPQLASRIPY